MCIYLDVKIFYARLFNVKKRIVSKTTTEQSTAPNNGKLLVSVLSLYDYTYLALNLNIICVYIYIVYTINV